VAVLSLKDACQSRGVTHAYATRFELVENGLTEIIYIIFTVATPECTVALVLDNTVYT